MNTPDNITELHDNEIFVFGSHESGHHAGGAARYAVNQFSDKEKDYKDTPTPSPPWAPTTSW